MNITLSDGVTVITLSPDLRWIDWHDWHPVEQMAERTITGALVIEPQTRVGGRPITLAPDADNSGAMQLDVLQQLTVWAGIPGQQLTLTMAGYSRTVVFRHHDDTGMSAKPFVFFNDPVSTDYFLTTLRFMEL